MRAFAPAIAAYRDKPGSGNRLLSLAAVALSCLFLHACEAVPGPVPTSPAATVFVALDSLPSGADVYVLNPEDNTLGQRLGSTPLNIPVGIAIRTDSEGSYMASYKFSDAAGWSGDDLTLNLMLIKDGYYKQPLVNKVIWNPNRNRLVNSSVAVTVPMSRVEGGATNNNNNNNNIIVLPGGQTVSTAPPPQAPVSVAAPAAAPSAPATPAAAPVSASAAPSAPASPAASPSAGASGAVGSPAKPSAAPAALGGLLGPAR